MEELADVLMDFMMMELTAFHALLSAYSANLQSYVHSVHQPPFPSEELASSVLYIASIAPLLPALVVKMVTF